ncbi:Conidiation-specific protein 13 [Paramyrothecium foliicola]|nr:Conidiation-specific protein 13 [Paramyrothecium foliicola]
MMLSVPRSAVGILACTGSLFSLSFAQSDEPILGHIPRISPPYDVWGEMDNALLGALSVNGNVGFSVSEWAPGWVPSTCFEHNWLSSLQAKDFVVYNITYDDCSEPFVLCRHKDSPASLGLIFTSISRIPARMRQWAGNFVAIPTVKPEFGGWQTGGTIVIQNDYWRFPGVMFHEMAHAMDLLKLNAGGWGYFSQTEGWWPMVQADNVLPTEYAATNYIEDFAEIARIFAYDYYVEGGLAALPPPVSQLHNQLSQFANVMGADYKLGQQCTGKVASSSPVAVPVAQFRGSRLKPGPKPNVAITTVPEIHVPPEALNMTPNCTLHVHE